MPLAVAASVAFLLSSPRSPLKASPPLPATISGIVKLDGEPPPERRIDMSSEPYCQNLNRANPLQPETVVRGADGALKNVVVYVSDGLSGAALSEVSPDTPNLDQRGCQYVPHVLVVNPKQHFKITNSDPTSHNVHAIPRPGGPNHEWNKSQSAGAPPLDGSWPAEEFAIHIRCNVHPWMSGYIAVVKGPHARTDDKGSYHIENLPAGEYTLTAWQEKYGTQSKKITVRAGEAATANFTFKAK